MTWQGRAVGIALLVSAVLSAGTLTNQGAHAEKLAPSQPTVSDFDGDGWSDLAVRSEENVMEDFEFSYGLVQVLFGGPNGLTGKRTQSFSATDFDPLEENNSVFGSVLAVGNFDGDGYSDLAVYTGPGVRILFGSAKGLTKERSRLWTSSSTGMAGNLDGSAGFGTTLVAEDFGRGPEDDLAIGARWHHCDAGAVIVMYGSTSGVTPTGSQGWSQDSPGVLDAAEGSCPTGGDLFGTSLAAGHFSGSGYADLAIGASAESFGRRTFAGAVTVLRGSATGLTATGNQLWTQDSPGVRGTAEKDDQFGSAVAAADFNGDTFADLAISVPTETVGRARAGAVSVIYGSRSGLQSSGNQFWSQGSRGVPGSNEKDDLFGSRLAVGQFGRDSGGRQYADLVIGVPLEGVGKRKAAGAVLVLYGSQNRLTATGCQSWTQNSAGLAGTSESNDEFGMTVATGHFGPGAYTDLAVGAPYDQLRGGAAGAVTVLHSTAQGLSAAGDTWLSAEDVGRTGPFRFGQFLVAR